MADPAYIDSDGVLTDGEAWVGIGTTTLGSDTASVTFTSTDDGQVGDFSQYMDLVVVSYARSVRVDYDDVLSALFNGDTAAESQYSVQQLKGRISTVTAFAGTSGGDSTAAWLGGMPSTLGTANVFAAVVSTFFDVNSGKYKSWLSQSAANTGSVAYGGTVMTLGGTYAKQAPITSIKLFPAYGSNLLSASSFSLFGVLPRMVA
jgi:hypothetical protein